MNCFEVLGIAETKDVKQIRKAYSGLLPKYSPEADSEGFQKLRAAYEEALSAAKEESPQNALSPIDKFMKDFEDTYRDFEKRIREDCWTELLDRDICCSIDTSAEISNKILTFLMSNYNLPCEVWRLLDSYFSWSTKQKKLYDKFPKNFTDYVIFRIKNSSDFRYEYLRGCRDNKQDTFIAEYNKISGALDNYDLYIADRSIKAAEELCPAYPGLLVLKGRYFMLNGEIEKAENILTLAINNDDKDIGALYNRAELYFKASRVKEAYEDYKTLLNIRPDHAPALYSAGKCCINLKRYKEAAQYLEKLTEMYPYRQDIMTILTSVYNFLIDELLPAAAENPQDIKTRYALAEAYIKTSKFEESRRILAELIESPEADADMYFMYCQVLTIQKDTELAYTVICRALELFKDNYNLNFYKADILNSLGRYEEAGAQYDIVLAINKEDPKAYNNKSYLFNIGKKYDEALKYADKAIALNPSMAHAYKNRAEALWGLKHYEDCMAACDEALNIYQYLIEAYAIKMKALIDLKLYGEALSVFSRANGLNLRDSRLYYERARICLLSKKYDEALNYYDLSIQADNKNADAYYYKAECLMLMSRINDALKTVDEALNLKPEDPGKYYSLKGSIIEKIHDFQEAFNQYEKAIKADPNCAYHYYMAGRSLNELKRYSEAVEYFKTSLKLDSNHMEVYADISYSLSIMGRNEECLYYCDRAIEINNNYMIAHQNKGWALYKLERYDEAERECNIALKLEGTNTKVLMLKARIYRQEGLYREALMMCDRILELNENDQGAVAMKKELLEKLDAKTEKQGLLKSLLKRK